MLDQSDIALTPTAQADVREPISSTCIATPFNMDGAACQGGAVGTPFFLLTAGTNPRGLFADAYAPEAPVTGDASAVDGSSATVSGTVNPQGASVKVSFQFGTTTAYGQTTATQTTGPASSATAVRGAAERAAGGHDDPLPGGREQRLRHLRRRRPDADDDRRGTRIDAARDDCRGRRRRRRRGRRTGPGNTTVGTVGVIRPSASGSTARGQGELPRRGPGRCAA